MLLAGTHSRRRPIVLATAEVIWAKLEGDWCNPPTPLRILLSIIAQITDATATVQASMRVIRQVATRHTADIGLNQVSQ